MHFIMRGMSVSVLVKSAGGVGGQRILSVCTLGLEPQTVTKIHKVEKCHLLFWKKIVCTNCISLVEPPSPTLPSLFYLGRH